MTATHRVSDAIDSARYQSLAAFVEWGIDMQLADIRDLLKLPMFDVGLESGQNFTVVAAMANVIAGASVWFFEASPAGLTNRGDRSRRYTEVLKRYWPWDGEAVVVDDGVRVLYNAVRNPLAHSFGLPDPEDPESTLISIRKRPLSDPELDELHRASQRPAWLGPAITPAPSGAPARAYVVSAPAMYWGVRWTLRSMLSDEAQLDGAEDLARTLVQFLTAPNASWRAAAGDP